MAYKHFDMEVTGIRQLTPRIKEFQLTTANRGLLPEYGPGAHIEVHTGNAQSGPLVRHYSLIGGTNDQDDPRNIYRIAVQREDRAGGSAFMHDHLVPGSRLKVSIPINNFPLDRKDSHSLLIAGGIGITPIYSMVRSLVRRHRSFTVVYAGRDLKQMAYHEQLMALAGARACLHISGTSNDNPLDLQALLRQQPADSAAYVCGPASMVAAAHQAGKLAGWPEGSINSELFGTGFKGDEVPFKVVLRRSGKVISVGKKVSILDALTAARVPVLWDCRRGECGLCEQHVMDTDGTLVHRDRYLSDDESAAGRSMCICVSRTSGTEIQLDL